ncbi:hypothetical protein C8R47DRAFT_1069026 [Mycena vitilis]|nr:hypothetical protein C8R47DRAFT_1069026 [Mycena vitilis]
MSVVSVYTKTNGELQIVPAKDRQAACAAAVAQAREAVEPSEHPPGDLYWWEWGLPVQASETAAALFLNVVAIVAHAAALRTGNAEACPLPSLRFITLPDPQRAVPLSNDSAPQDCRPDVVALEYSAFRDAPETNAAANFFLVQASPFQYIRDKLPAALGFTAAHRSANGPAITAFERWFAEKSTHNHLDMTRFCWPELQLTVEAKLSAQYHAMLQEFVYMRQQRRTQPWMRSILGLVITTKIIGLLRADTLGIEQCTFDRASGRGVLDSIRICLGLVRSTCLQRGQHEAFQLGDTKEHGRPHLKPKHAKPAETTSAADADVDDVFTEGDNTKVKDEKVEYTHRTVRFITLPDNRVHYPTHRTKTNVTYYVHHLVQDNGSLVGRCARIFCVSREVKEKDSARQFVGPYALKLYNTEHTSDCYAGDLIKIARDAQVKNVLLPTWEWRYSDALSLRGFGADIVANYDKAAVVPTVVSNREEVFAQTDLKRLLVQCASYEEFEAAFIDFTRGIGSLAEKHIAHRDLSIGNVLLSQDTPCSAAFFSHARAIATATLGTPVNFKQRELEQRVGGLLHDMDMAGRVHPPPRVNKGRGDIDALLANFKPPVQPKPPAQPVGPQKGFRTGTPPFMAIGLLLKGPPHTVAYDLHSLLFVMVLFFYSYDEFSDVSFPERVHTRNRPWPQDVLRWTNRPMYSPLSELGNIKRGFFADPPVLMQRLRAAFEGDLWAQNLRYVKLFLQLYLILWEEIPESDEFKDRLDVTAEEMETTLEQFRNTRLAAAQN